MALAAAPPRMVLVQVGTIRRFDRLDVCDNKHCKVAVRVGMQPGDNWRFCAAKEEDETALRDMTQNQADLWQPPPRVAESRMLTTWRKLHLELDSMAFTWDYNVVGRNLDETYGPDIPHPGDSGADINDWCEPDNGRYEGGCLYLYGGPDFEIIDNEFDTVYVMDRVQPPVGDITPYKNWTAGFCDDDVLIEPRTVDWSLVNEKFAPAYIEAEEDVAARSLDAPFVPTAGRPLDVAEAKRIRRTSPSYWVALILSSHQAYKKTDYPYTTPIISSVDGDPDWFYHIHPGSRKDGDKGLVLGRTEYVPQAQCGFNDSLVFLEAIREGVAWSDLGYTQHRNNREDDQEKRTVVHELGHQFGWIEEGPPGTIMEQGGDNTTDVFNEDQLKTLRECDDIEREPAE